MGTVGGGVCRFGRLFIGGILVPQSIATWADPGLEIGNDVHSLTSAMELLKEEKIMEQAPVDFMKDKLKQVQDDASGCNPKKTFDALDNIRDSLSRTARKAAEGAIQKAEKLGKGQGLAEALGNNDGTIDPKLHKEAMTELAALVEKALDENDFADLNLEPSDLMGNLSPDDLKKLGNCSRAVAATWQRNWERLAQTGLIDLSLCKECEKAGECDCEGSVQRIGVKKLLSKRGGRGGVTERQAIMNSAGPTARKKKGQSSRRSPCLPARCPI